MEEPGAGEKGSVCVCVGFSCSSGVAFKKNFMPGGSRPITPQVAQAPLGTVSITLRNSVIIRVCMGV